MIASVTPAEAAISLVVVPSNPLREKKSSAVSRSWRRRSLAGRRGVADTAFIVSQYLLTVKSITAAAAAGECRSGRRSSLRPAHSPSQPRFPADGGPVAGARHRSQHRDL